MTDLFSAATNTNSHSKMPFLAGKEKREQPILENQTSEEYLFPTPLPLVEHLPILSLWSPLLNIRVTSSLHPCSERREGRGSTDRAEK